MRYSALLMLMVTPQFRQFASTLPGLGIDDAMSLPQSITYPDEIIKSGKASMQCMPIILSCLNSPSPCYDPVDIKTLTIIPSRAFRLEAWW
jgi:hypothetical protein